MRVEEAGRQYQPAQYVIDVGAGDTSKLMFADVRIANRAPRGATQSGQQQGQSPGFSRPRFGEGTGAAPRAPATAPASGAGLSEDAASIPFRLPPRVWQHMSAQEQQMLRLRWSRMSPEQQRRAVSAVQQRDTMAARFPRRPPQPPATQPRL